MKKGITLGMILLGLILCATVSFAQELSDKELEIYYEWCRYLFLRLDEKHEQDDSLADEILKNLRNYQGRLKTVHLKEYSSTNEQALLGEGEMNWSEFFNVCKTIGGTKWYIIEQENCSFLPLECARLSIMNFKKIMSKT